MRLAGVAAVSAALLVSACTVGGGDLAADLQADLNAASTKIELAASAPAQPMRFVSELEQGREAEETQRKRTPRPVAAQFAGVEQTETRALAPEQETKIAVASTPEPAPETPQPAVQVSAVPSVAPRPAALPVDYPSEGTGRGSGVGVYGDGGGRGGIGVGDIIGVVIRGGGVGPDHCPPRRRGRTPGRGGVIIMPNAPIPTIIR